MRLHTATEVRLNLILACFGGAASGSSVTGASRKMAGTIRASSCRDQGSVVPPLIRSRFALLCVFGLVVRVFFSHTSHAPVPPHAMP